MALPRMILFSMPIAQLLTSSDDPSVPAGQARLVLQSPEGQAQLMVTDEGAVAILTGEWAPYKAAVDEAIANGTPWPDAPVYTLTLLS